MLNEKIREKNIRKKIIFRFILLIIYAIIIFSFYYLLHRYGANPLIIILLIGFVSLTIVGPFLRKNKRSLYSRMFPDRKRRSASTSKISRSTISKENELELRQPKIFKPIDLETNYRRPIINKCGNCGNIVPSFVKVCPFCKHEISK